jgi:transcription initiation factor IIE alpha subunit
LTKRLGTQEEETRKIIEYLDRHKIINRRAPEKAMIRETYYKELREQDYKVRETIYELSAKHDVSYSFVSGIIYDKESPPHKF